MKPHASRQGLGIRARIVVLAVIPLLAIAILIGGYTVQVRLSDARLGLEERGRIVADNLAMAAELALFTRNLEQLQSLCETALRQSDVAWAGIRAADGELLASGGKTLSSGTDNSRLFHAPVGTEGVPLTDFAGETTEDEPARPLGWAEVRLSLEGTLARQREIMANSLIIIVGGLLMSLLAALRIGSGISEPLLKLSDAMTRYREGDLGVRIDTPAEGEIGELARGFNRMAQALEGSQALLREQVSSATEELQRTVEELSQKNTQLETAREEALAAGREKHEFLARMSHEIRTPLNAVIGFSRLLRDGAAEKDVLEYTQTVDRAANQLLYVIDGILSFTKLESGNLELERSSFDPRACLEDVVAMLRPAAHEKGLELALVMHRDIPETLLGDPGRIAQVLVNLVNNAVKFTAKGHVFVEAGYEAPESGDGALRIAVNDTGIGLSPEELGRLFQPFIQADSAITRRYGGTGLGLYISKRLIELMDGEIEVESEPGRGSRFSFAIPCRSAPEPLPELGPGPLTGRKILVYDRHRIQRRALRTLLLGWSMEIFTSGRSEEVPGMLERAASAGHPYQLLILGLDSEESRPKAFERLVSRLRTFYPGPVLVLVGTEHWEIPADARLHGELEWAIKPARRSLIYRYLCRLSGMEADREPAVGTEVVHPAFAGLRVLVVEDNAFNRLLMRRMLERRGADVREAWDGSGAIAEARRYNFDLIFMDIHMPGIDGIETARRIRSLGSEGSCPPIIALSADVFAEDQGVEGVPVFDDFLLKPVSGEALDNAINRAVGDAIGDPDFVPPAAAQQPTDLDCPPEIPAELEAQLMEELSSLTKRLGEAISGGDEGAARELTHELKGLCGFFGLKNLQGPIRELALAAREAPLTELAERLRALQELGGNAEE